MAQVYAIDGLRPVVDQSAFAHLAAVLVGDVIVGADCCDGPGARRRLSVSRYKPRRETRRR